MNQSLEHKANDIVRNSVPKNNILNLLKLTHYSQYMAIFDAERVNVVKQKTKNRQR